MHSNSKHLDRMPSPVMNTTRCHRLFKESLKTRASTGDVMPLACGWGLCSSLCAVLQGRALCFFYIFSSKIWEKKGSEEFEVSPSASKYIPPCLYPYFHSASGHPALLFLLVLRTVQQFTDIFNKEQDSYLLIYAGADHNVMTLTWHMHTHTNT